MDTEKLAAWQSGIAILEDNVFAKQSLPDQSPQVEKRKDPRFNIKVPLQYRISDISAAWVPTESKDISNTGIRLSLEKTTPIGTKIELDVQLPGSEKKILIEGTVVWARPSSADNAKIECGIAFQNLRKVTGKEKLLQFISDKLCNLAIKCTPKNLSCYPADNLEELKLAYRLIYREYQYRGYCETHPSGMHYSFYCTLPESRTFVLKRDQHLLGTVSIIVDSLCGVPMESIFPESISKLRSTGRKIAEVSLLAVDHEAFQKKTFSLTDFQKLTGTFFLFKVLFDYARLVSKVTDLVIAVHPKHEDLYRYLEFEILDSPRPYSSACNKPALPMRLNIRRAIESLPASRGVLRYFMEPIVPMHTLAHAFLWDASAIKEMLVNSKDLWKDLPQRYKDYLRSLHMDLRI